MTPFSTLDNYYRGCPGHCCMFTNILSSNQQNKKHLNTLQKITFGGGYTQLIAIASILSKYRVIQSPKKFPYILSQKIHTPLSRGNLYSNFLPHKMVLHVLEPYTSEIILYVLFCGSLFSTSMFWDLSMLLFISHLFLFSAK